MFLLLDIGNTRIKLGWYQEDTLVNISYLNHHDSIINAISSCTRPIKKIVGICVASHTVQDRITQELANICPIQWLTTPQRTGDVINQYNPANKLGVDRWYGLVGMHYHETSATPRILVNFGTATTIDTLSPTHQFVGGLIAPGLDLMLQSLHRGTAQLPIAEGQYQRFPNNTNDAIISGVINAQLGAIQAQVHHATQTFGITPKVFVTGGAWEFIKTNLHQTAINDQMLGLEYIETPIFDGLIYQLRLGLVH